MIFDEADDPLVQELRLLRRLSPDPARAERVRARCHAHLERCRRSERSAALLEVVHYLVPPLVLGFCGMYVAELVGTALRVHGLLD